MSTPHFASPAARRAPAAGLLSSHAAPPCGPAAGLGTLTFDALEAVALASGTPTGSGALQQCCCLYYDALPPHIMTMVCILMAASLASASTEVLAASAT